VFTDGQGWARKTGIPVSPILTNDSAGVYRADNHAWLFATSGGKVFHAGPSKQMNFFDPAGAGSFSAAGTRADDGDAMNGTATMYDVGKILTVGGAPDYQDTNATKNAYAIDISAGTATAPTVRKLAPMAFARAFHNSVVLPDGQVFVAGGQSLPVPFSDANSALTPELWSPATETFRPMAPMTTPRNYHSVGLLLPDARVMVGGGGMCGTCTTNHADAEIFSPPYLFAADGTAAARPAITSAPTTAQAGATISVTTDRAVSRFSLVRFGSVTHTVNTDQRRISLTTTTGTVHNLQIPADRGVVVPGPYMLFALDASGVPSVATTIFVQ
jgi:galactose oxidase